MQNGEGGIGVGLMNKLKQFGNNEGVKDFGARAEEASSLTGLTQAKDIVVDVGTTVAHGVGEIAKGAAGGLNVAADKLNHAADYMDDTAGNLGRSIKYDVNGEVIVAGAKKFGMDVLGKVQSAVENTAFRTASEAATWYNDHVVPALRMINVKDSGFAFQNMYDNRREADVNPSEKARVRSQQMVEGEDLMSKVMGDMKAAADFDRLKDSQVSLLLEKALGSTEMAVKLGPTLIKAISELAMVGSNFGSTNPKTQESLSNILQDPQMLQELRSKQIDVVDLLSTIQEALLDISSKKDLVLKSRGESANLSFEYEGDLIKASERLQADALDLGFDVLQALPKDALQLNVDNMVGARAKAIDFSRKANEATNPLKSVALSLEKRFPDKKGEIRAAFSEIMSKWTESKGVAKGLIDAIQVDEKTKKVAEKDLFVNVIKPNELFNELTKDQQEAVMLKLGGKITDETRKNTVYKYERIPGSVYDQAVQSHEQYISLTMAYGEVRKHVAEHPEAADRLIMLAERIVQTKSVMELTRSKMKSEIIVQSRKVKNEGEFAALRQGNIANEDATRIKQAEYYAAVLSRFNERVQREAPTVKKIAKILGVVGVTVVIGKEAAPDVVEAVIAAAKLIAKVAVENAPMVGKALGTGVGLWGITEIYGWARQLLGKSAEKSAKGYSTEAEQSKRTAKDSLQDSYDQLMDLGQLEAAAKIKEVMDGLS